MKVIQRPMIAVPALLGAPGFEAEAVHGEGKNIRTEFDVPEHNWKKYDWGSRPDVRGRLYQGPFRSTRRRGSV